MPKVLLADDNQEMLDTLERIFAFHEFEVEKAEDGNKAIELAVSSHPDLILLDGMMPEMDGFEACRILKSNPETKDIPIVFLTANYIEENDKVAGFELGADDYILKPFNSKELVARSQAILKRHEMLRELRSENNTLANQNRKIEEDLQNIIHHSQATVEKDIIDSLTRVYTKAFFERRLTEEFERAKRYSTSLSVVLIRLNGFDKMAVKLGNQAGNYLSLKIANHLLSQTRTSDVLARSDDGIFMIILPQTDDEGAETEAERLRETLARTEFFDEEMVETLSLSKRRSNKLQRLTVNVGVVCYPCIKKDIQNADQIIQYAQAALDKAIENGNDRVCFYNQMQA